jgi:hypothetical protein
MPARYRPAENQLALAGLEPTPPAVIKPRKKKPVLILRTDNLERRVTRLEAEIALLNGQLEREEEDDW